MGYSERPTVTVGLSDLTPHPENYNTHGTAQISELAESLDTFGQFKNVVCWSPTEAIALADGRQLYPAEKYILAGHGLWMAAMERGLDTIEVKDYTGLPYEDALLLMKVDNAAPLGSVADREKLTALLAKTRATVADRPGLRAMLDRLREREGLGGGNGGGEGAEPADVSETEAERLAKQFGVEVGQRWQLGRHVIACLDCLERANIERLTDGQQVGAIWSDPPYGLEIVAAHGYVGGGELYDIPFGGVKNRIGKGLGSIDGAKPFGKEKPVRGSDGASNLVEAGKYAPVIGDETTATARQSFSLLYDLYPDACHIWWGGNYYTDVLPPSPGWIVWDKDNTGNFADCELAWTNQDRAARIFEHRWNGMLKASEQGQRRVHPTQKPVKLFEWATTNYFPKGGLILDPFLGSGISVLGAETLGENYRVIGLELSAAYVGATIHRWQQMTGLEPVLLDGS